MKKTILLLLQATLILALAACSAASVATTELESTTQVAAGNEAVAVTADTSPVSVNFSDEDLNPGTDNSATSYIKLEGDTISSDGVGITVNGSILTITSAGIYNISGVLNNGQIVVNTEDEATVTLVLNGVNITNTSSAPIYVKSADKVVITLADGTDNAVTDGAEYVFENTDDDKPNAAIFSKDDLTINGNGSLTINANYNNGIATKDDLKITSGVITVNAVNDGIKGKNYIAVKDGTITINAGGDGMQSNNDEDATKGYVLIEGGTFNIIAGMDGIQAETKLDIKAGNITIVSGGGSVVNYQLDDSAKGLKAGVDVTIAGGTINIDSADDGIHSNNSVTINGGDITVASGDDGVHADTAITMNSGSLIITKSYEGVESTSITISGGSTSITSQDDGINGSGGSDGSSFNMGPRQDQFAASNAYVYINGGYLYVDANGDGLDSNGSIDMTGGTVIVNGPTNNGNGAIDYNATFTMTGGYLLAVGSSGMAEAPSTSSTQYAVVYNFDIQQTAGTLIHIATADGTEVLTFAPSKTYQSVVFSSPELVNGASYVIYTGGSATGTITDGLYADASYTSGSQVTSFTISSAITSLGAAGNFDPGGGGHGGGGMPGNPPPARP